MSKLYFLKAFTVLSLLLGFSIIVLAQRHDIDWAIGIGKEDMEGGSSIVTDSAGNIYTVGYVIDTLDFDPGPGVLSVPGIQPPFNGNFFIYKTTNNGIPVWVKSIAGIPNSSDPPNISIDSSGYLYIAGNFSDTVDFDPGLGTRKLIASGVDMFVMKLDSAGNLIWVKSVESGTTGSLGNIAIKNDASGNVYISGGINTWTDSIDFDPGPGIARQKTGSLVFGDFFILKLNTSGDYRWAKTINRCNNVVDIAVDRFGNVVALGDYGDTVDFDPGPNTYNLTRVGNIATSDIFLLKLDSVGNFLWARSIGGEGTELSGSVAVDAAGSIYSTGSFGFKGGSMGGVSSDFDPGVGVYNLTTIGMANIFISKLDKDGNFSWAKFLGGTFMDWALSLNVSDSRVYTGVSIFVNDTLGTGNVDFDPGADVFNVRSPIPGSVHLGVSILDTGGNFVWGGIIGPPTLDAYNFLDITNDIYGNVLVTGGYSALDDQGGDILLDFDPGPGNVPVHYTGAPPGVNRSQDIFIAKLEPCATRDTTFATTCDSFKFNGQTFTAAGNYKFIYPAGSPTKCDSISVLALVISTPETAVTQSGATLTSMATSGTYQWIDCDDNMPVTGATGKIFTPQQAGSYAVVVTTGSGCIDTSDCYTVTSIYGPALNGLQIYPNPAQKMVTIQAKQTFQKASFRLLNIVGETLWQQVAFNGNALHLDMVSFASGIYTLEITEAGKTVRTKLIKQ